MPNIEIIRGTDPTIGVNLTQGGSSIDLTGYSVMLRVSKVQDQDTPNLEITGILAGTPNNRVSFTLTNIQTAGLENGRYYYDILFSISGSNSITNLDTFIVKNAVT